MELNEIENHWKNWAREFKSDIRATTKTRTIKELEVNALFKAIASTPLIAQKGCEVLEVGCGNGHNCFMLSDHLPGFSFTGVDLFLIWSPAQNTFVLIRTTLKRSDFTRVMCLSWISILS